MPKNSRKSFCLPVTKLVLFVSMEDLEAEIRRAQRLVDNQHTYRWLDELGITPVTETLLATLACIACKNLQYLPATAETISSNDCAPVKTVYNLSLRLSEQGVVIRSAIPAKRRLGKPPYHHSLADAPEKVLTELISNRPCERQL